MPAKRAHVKNEKQYEAPEGKRNVEGARREDSRNSPWRLENGAERSRAAGGDSRQGRHDPRSTKPPGRKGGQGHGEEALTRWPPPSVTPSRVKNMLPARSSSPTRDARRRAGFEFASISDHFHPWVGQQGHSPFVWRRAWARLRHRPSRIEVGVGVSLSRIIRIHPAVVGPGPRATTCAALRGPLLSSGVGTGEAFERAHPWTPAGRDPRVRRQMLEEAVGVIRALFHRRDDRSPAAISTRVENAKTVRNPPDTRVPDRGFRASDPRGAKLAGPHRRRLLGGSAPDSFASRPSSREAGGRGHRLPRSSTCVGRRARAEGRDQPHTRVVARNAGNPRAALARPSDVGRTSNKPAEIVTPDVATKSIPCGSRHCEAGPSKA